MAFRTKVFICIPIIVVLVISTSFAYAAEVKELQLAGIRLGRSALSIIQKYGNPTEIRVGSTRQAATDTGAGSPFGTAEGPPPGMGGASNPFAALEGPPPSAGGSSASGQSSPFQGSTGGKANKQSAPEVTWIYRFPKNHTLEFIINPDGIVIQIAAFGVDWPGIGTSKGIKLGSTYKDVIMKYGYPESHQKSGMQMVTKYIEKNRVAFTFLGKTVVGITIALWD
ncbi:MAG: hypothetical protein K6T99_07840 [Armatimonadetes bacterium]|nr:hypothetical protein [Armatimonadota bacterium]